MVNNLVKLPEISAQMQEMSREMMKVWAWTWNKASLVVILDLQGLLTAYAFNFVCCLGWHN